MLWAVGINGAAGLAMSITFAFSISTMDLGSILSSPTGYPFMQVFHNATGTTGGASALSMFPLVIGFASNLTMLATSSRQLYAFARDGALPFGPWLSRVSAGAEVPVNAIVATSVVASLLSLINLGSAVALNSLTSLSTCALLSAYITCIGCMAWRRWTGAPLLPSRFGLGRYGLAVNLTSLVFLVALLVLAFFPEYVSPDAEEMNWNILVYGFVVLFSLAYYFLYGRKRYVGPVEYVRKLE